MRNVFFSLPALHGIAFASLLGVNWLTKGTVSPEAPQVVANHAYRELWSGHSEGPRGAIKLFRRALAMDPAFPYRWSDLGDALAATGMPEPAAYCFRRSFELAPHSPQIAIRAANFHLLEGQTSTALQLGATVLRETTEYDNMVFNSWMRLGGSPDEVLSVGIGNNERAAEAYLGFLIRANDQSRLFDAWRWMERHSYANRPLATTWARWLIGHQHEDDALVVWKRYVTRDSTFGAGNWIDNSGFEDEPVGTGFDWRLQSSVGVKVERDASVARSGRWSLRLAFDGSENVDFTPAAQRVRLPPGRYRLTAWMRTANLSTDQGLTLVLNGVSTAALSGVNDWTRMSADVMVPADAPSGEIDVVRKRSWRFDGKVSGTAWIDDVELRRID